MDYPDEGGIRDGGGVVVGCFDGGQDVHFSLSAIDQFFLIVGSVWLYTNNLISKQELFVII
jgi:hypothetical protein